MEDIMSICREHTTLTAMQQELLKRMLVVFPFLADLAHARVRLYLLRSDKKSFVVAAEHWPHTVYLTPDAPTVGEVVRTIEEPLLCRAMQTGRFSQGKREWNYGSMIDMMAEPVYDGNTILGIVCFETTSENRAMEGYSRLLDASRLLLKSARKQLEPAMYQHLSASDGIIITDQFNRITFATTAATRIFRVLGVQSLVGGHLFDRKITQHITKETQVTSRPWEREIEVGGLVLLERDLPIKEGGRLLCRILVISDLTEVREKDREIQVQSAVIQEIHHRVKNNLQTIASLLRMQARRSKSPDVKAALKEGVNRILSIAIVHEFLSEQGHATVNVKELAEQIFNLVAMSMVDRDFHLETSCEGEPLILPSSYASSIGLVLNELVLNATEHGFEGRHAGRICLAMREEPAGYVLTFTDDGIGLPEGFDAAHARSLGVSIMRTLIEGDLGGSIQYDDAPGGGTRVTVAFPKNHKQPSD